MKIRSPSSTLSCKVYRQPGMGFEIWICTSNCDIVYSLYQNFASACSSNGHSILYFCFFEPGDAHIPWFTLQKQQWNHTFKMISRPSLLA